MLGGSHFERHSARIQYDSIHAGASGSFVYLTRRWTCKSTRGGFAAANITWAKT